MICRIIPITGDNKTLRDILLWKEDDALVHLPMLYRSSGIKMRVAGWNIDEKAWAISDLALWYNDLADIQVPSFRSDLYGYFVFNVSTIKLQIKTVKLTSGGRYLICGEPQGPEDVRGLIFHHNWHHSLSVLQRKYADKWEGMKAIP